MLGDQSVGTTQSQRAGDASADEYGRDLAAWLEELRRFKTNLGSIRKSDEVPELWGRILRLGSHFHSNHCDLHDHWSRAQEVLLQPRVDEEQNKEKKRDKTSSS